MANDGGAPGVGFEHDTNAVVIVTADGMEHDVALSNKRAIAKAVLDAVVVARRAKQTETKPWPGGQRQASSERNHRVDAVNEGS